MRKLLVLVMLFIVHWNMIMSLDGSVQPMQLTFSSKKDADEFARVLTKSATYTDITVEELVL